MRARQYQKEAVDFSISALAKGRRGVVQLPTGTGKSLVLLEVAIYWLRQGRPVYIIAPTEQAVLQIQQLARQFGHFSCLDIQNKTAPSKAQLIISTYACAWRRYKKRITAKTLCLIDECHHINFKAPVNNGILTSFQSSIGFSATPWSKGCLVYFDKNPYVYELSRAIKEGFICEYEIEQWRDPTRGNYQIVYTNQADYREYICGAIAHSDYAIYSRKSAQQVIRRFRNGLVGTIVVNRMLTEGFDLPQIKTVWICRALKSRISAMQIAGRALRPYAGKKATIYVRSERIEQLLSEAFKKAG